jgi:N-acylneuraminate cytidylyltransferase/CMP-N,N'-diacetyllegionaminic acid synthase
MYQDKTVLGFIPARAGSKGIPEKNIKLLAGKPLIVHTIEAAKTSSIFDYLIVSTACCRRYNERTGSFDQT